MQLLKFIYALENSNFNEDKKQHIIAEADPCFETTLCVAAEKMKNIDKSGDLVKKRVKLS